MRKILSLCLAITAALLFVNTSAMALIDYVPIPSIYEGTYLESGVSQTGTQDAGEYYRSSTTGAYDGEWDLWGFYADAGDIVTITGDNHPDTRLSLFSGLADTREGFRYNSGSDGVSYITQNDDYSGLNPQVQYTVATEGYYTAAITGYSSSSIGNTYDIQVTGNSVGPAVPVAPEPVSSVLFVVGGTVLGFRRFSKKKEVVAV